MSANYVKSGGPYLPVNSFFHTYNRYQQNTVVILYKTNTPAIYRGIYFTNLQAKK